MGNESKISCPFGVSTGEDSALISMATFFYTSQAGLGCNQLFRTAGGHNQFRQRLYPFELTARVNPSLFPSATMNNNRAILADYACFRWASWQWYYPSPSLYRVYFMAECNTLLLQSTKSGLGTNEGMIYRCLFQPDLASVAVCS